MCVYMYVFPDFPGMGCWQQMRVVHGLAIAEFAAATLHAPAVASEQNCAALRRACAAAVAAA